MNKSRIDMPNTALSLLILDTPDNASEEFISIITHSQLVVNSHRVTQMSDLTEALIIKHWDLVLINDEVKGINIDECARTLSRSNSVASLLVLSARVIGIDEITNSYIAGISAIVSLKTPDYLRAVVTREFSIVKERRDLIEKRDNNSELIKRCQLLLDSSREAVAYIHEGMHIYANKSYMSKFKYDDLDELICVPIIDLVVDDCKDDLKACLVKTQSEAESSDVNDKGTVFDIVGLCENGLEFKAQLFLKPTLYEGEKCLQVMVNTEEEERKNLRRVTNRDNETGLFNRHFFLNQLNELIKNVNSGKSSGGTLVYIGIENLDAARSSLGYEEAGKAILEVAQILKIDTAKKHVTARFGDSTFTILLDAGNSLETLKEMIAEIMESLDGYQPKCLTTNLDLQVSCNIVTVEIMRNTRTAKEVLDIAYKATSSEVNVEDDEIVIQLPVAEEEVPVEMEVISKGYMNKALSNNNFALAYQPIIPVTEVEAEIYEIYLRLYDDTGKLYMADQFMNVVNESGLGNRLDRWVIDKALQVLVDLYNRGQTVQFVLNITEQSMKDALFAEWLARSMKDCCLGNEAVVVNLYEETVISNTADAYHLIQKINEVGARVCISRYSNSNVIQEFIAKADVGYVKLADEITENVVVDNNYRSELKIMVSHLNSRGIKVIAPKIENSGVLSILWTIDVDFLQGNYFQKAEEDLNFDSFNEQIEM